MYQVIEVENANVVWEVGWKIVYQNKKRDTIPIPVTELTSCYAQTTIPPISST
jgi:hypothetical protein